MPRQVGRPKMSASFKSEYAGVSTYALPRLVNGLAVQVSVCWSSGEVSSTDASLDELTQVLRELKAEKYYWQEAFLDRADKCRAVGDEQGEEHNRRYAQGFREREERLHIKVLGE